jgi:hypothetical protein
VWGVSVTLRPLFTPGKDPVSILEESGWAPGPVWIGAENLAPTRFRSPDRPAGSQSLYRLNYPANHVLFRSTVNEMRLVQEYDGYRCYSCCWNIFILIEKVWSVHCCASEV